jgi:hypothetical protein
LTVFIDLTIAILIDPIAGLIVFSSGFEWLTNISTRHTCTGHLTSPETTCLSGLKTLIDLTITVLINIITERINLTDLRLTRRTIGHSSCTGRAPNTYPLTTTIVKSLIDRTITVLINPVTCHIIGELGSEWSTALFDPLDTCALSDTEPRSTRSRSVILIGISIAVVVYSITSRVAL